MFVKNEFSLAVGWLHTIANIGRDFFAIHTSWMIMQSHVTITDTLCHNYKEKLDAPAN